jgi:DNA repair protein RadC
MISRPFKNFSEGRTKKVSNSESFIELQVEEWIKNNMEDFYVLIQQEEMRLLEEDPLLDNANMQAEQVIREVIKKKFK